jgi:hypothetical protein
VTDPRLGRRSDAAAWIGSAIAREHGMHASKSTRAVRDITASLPTVVCHGLGARLTALLAHELTVDDFRVAVAVDATAARRLNLDVVLLERDPLVPQDLINDARRCCPGARLISVFTVAAVTIVHTFVDVPRALDVERLRVLAAAVRRATRSAAADTTCCRRDDTSSASAGARDEAHRVDRRDVRS